MSRDDGMDCKNYRVIYEKHGKDVFERMRLFCINENNTKQYKTIASFVLYGIIQMKEG